MLAVKTWSIIISNKNNKNDNEINIVINNSSMIKKVW